MTAAQLLAAALAGGADGLSARDCWILLAYGLSGGNTAQQQITAALGVGYDQLSNHDLLEVIAFSL
jgi:hypothetical protein